MPDVVDQTPPAVDQTDNLTIWWVPTIANVAAPTALEIGATGSKRITYSFVPGGWTPTGDTEILTDDRLTLKQPLQAFGKTTRDITMQYVDSTDATSAAVVLVEGTAGYIVERRGVPNATLVAAGQKVRVHKVTLGPQIAGPIDGNGKFTITQKAIYTGVLGNPVAVA